MRAKYDPDLPVPHIFGTKLPVANISGNYGSKYLGNWKMRVIHPVPLRLGALGNVFFLQKGCGNFCPQRRISFRQMEGRKIRYAQRIRMPTPHDSNTPKAFMRKNMWHKPKLGGRFV